MSAPYYEDDLVTLYHGDCRDPLRRCRMTCWGCGLARTIDDTGCLACDLCEGCTPAEGNCLTCRDMRAEDITERTVRYAIESEVCS